MSFYTQLNVTAEVASSGTLAIAPDLALLDRADYQTRVYSTAKGNSNIYRRRKNVIRAFEASWSSLTTAQKDSLKTFYESMDGTLLAFTYTPPEGVAGKYRFATSLGVTIVAPNVWNLTAVLEELEN